jgi:hypothetical protein
MFVPLWLCYLVTGTVMAVLVLAWALGTHQFEDQDRARYLPLADLSPAELAAPPPDPARVRPVRLAFALALLLGLGTVAASAAVILRTVG